MTAETIQVTRAPSDDGALQVQPVPVADGVLQEQPLPLTSENKQMSGVTSSIVDKTVDVVEKTLEATVSAVDPLNVFAPCIQPTRLVMKTGFYSSASNQAFPLVECRTKFSYNNLACKSTEDDLMVVEDTSTGETVVVVERTGGKPDQTYQIFKTSKAHDGQEPVKKHNGQDLYPLAMVEHTSPRDLHVLMNGETEPTYTVEKAGIPASYATNYFIKQPGVKEEVASTHPWEGNNYMLVVNAGMDVILMLCLGIIADDAGTEGHKEQPMTAEYKKQMSGVTTTIVDKVEATVSAVDPLNIFSPCIQPTRLVMKSGFYASASNQAFPLVECRTKFSYNDLACKSTEDDLLLVEDTSTGETVVVVERTGAKPDQTYQIFKTTKAHDGQEPVKKNGQDLYALAKVEHTSPRDLKVLMGGETEPTYTIEKASIPANYAANYFIKQSGVKEEVASTHPWQGHNYMLVVNPGMDVILMLCLGIIADDSGSGGRRKESFSEMVTNLNPKKLVRKLTSSAGSERKGDDE